MQKCCCYCDHQCLEQPPCWHELCWTVTDWLMLLLLCTVQLCRMPRTSLCGASCWSPILTMRDLTWHRGQLQGCWSDSCRIFCTLKRFELGLKS
jgi:hypothetical protein